MAKKNFNIDTGFVIRQQESVRTEGWQDKQTADTLQRSLFALNNGAPYMLRFRDSAGGSSLSGISGNEADPTDLDPIEDLGFLTENLVGTVLALESGDILAQE